MKKTLSVILAIAMLITMSLSAINVFAEGEICDCGCGCDDCTMVMNTCHCCVDCQYLDFSYLLDCAKDETTGHYKGFGCCAECKGIWPCDCGCGCEYCGAGDEQAPDPIGPVIPADAQSKIIKIFQDVMNTLNNVINNVFAKLYELLGIKR